MKPVLLILCLAFLLAGCVSHSQVMVNNQGQWYRCSSWGHGLEGVVMAGQIHSDCLASMRAVGYIEIEKAGVVGIVFADAMPIDTVPTILKIADSSPAAEVGLKSGDKLLLVDSIRVRTINEARMALFGLAGTSVNLTILRNDQQLNFKITRAAYSAVFGIPAATKSNDPSSKPAPGKDIDKF